jgi:putative inorganic carbon (HCO3(-)) transporter
MRELILLGIILVCAAIALRKPVFGMLTFVWLGFFNPQSMTWGSTPHSLIMAFATIAGYFFSSEPKRFPVQRESILLLLLWIVFGMTTAFAIYPDRAVQTLILVSKIFMMVFLSMCLLNTEKRLQWLVRVIALSLGFYAVKGILFVLFTGGENLVFGPLGSFLEANNMIGLALAMNLPWLAYLIKEEKQAWLRWICRGMFISSYPSIIFTYSRGAWLGLVVVTALMALRSRYKFRIAATTTILALFLTPLVITFIPERLAERYEDLENYDTESSAQMRLGSWAYCWRVAMDNPVTGGGFEHYSVPMYEKYAPEYLDKWGGTRRRMRTACHSVWLSVIGEHGLLGAILWFGLIGSVFLSCWQIRSLAKAYREMSWMSNLAGALQISLVAYAVVGTFIDAAYFDMLYYLMAVVVIMKERVENSSVTDALPQAGNVVDKRILITAKGSFSR